MKANIVLIGFMGAGKTSTGKRLAEILQMEFVDTDKEIEKLTGITISQIFARHGEVRFRSEEHLIVTKAANRTNCVIATGGGAVLNEENVRALQRNGILICLTASPEVIQARVSKRGGRPLLQKDKSVEKIRQMMEERKPFYAQADFTLDTSELSQEETVDRILAYLQERGVIDGNTSR
ncbi:MAG TPA: shikimate kinase [Clostridia bacterium]|nr:shikimate kinase [Clostridia bacterium]